MDIICECDSEEIKNLDDIQFILGGLMHDLAEIGLKGTIKISEIGD